MAKNVENINKRNEEVWKNNILGKRKAFKKDKEEIQKRFNTVFTVFQPSSATQPK